MQHHGDLRAENQDGVRWLRTVAGSFISQPGDRAMPQDRRNSANGPDDSDSVTVERPTLTADEEEFDITLDSDECDDDDAADEGETESGDAFS
jgi:hypothetical protein